MDKISLGPRVQDVPLFVKDDPSPEEVRKEWDLMSFAIVSHRPYLVLTRLDKSKYPTRDDY